MKYNKIENLFNDNFVYDKKHKLNTSPKNLPLDILENINKGITLEQLDALASKDYDIYKYSTQITIHGICDDLTDYNVLMYKSLLLNKNKSLGVKWTAVDSEKKSNICKTLGYFGWTTVQSSTKFYPTKIIRFTSKEEAVKQCSVYRNIIDRIGNNMFYGSYNIYIGEIFSMYFAVIELFINGIKQENVIPLLEKILDMDNETINNNINNIESEKKRKSDAFHELYLKEQKEKDAKKNTLISNTINKLKNDGYKKANSNELKDGTRFIAIENRCYEIYLCEYEITTRTCICLSKKDILNNRESYETNNAKIYKDKQFEVWVK